MRKAPSSSSLYPVIMAGGSGTRFWPLSRKARPKQFLPLVTEQPLLVETLARLGALASPKQTFVVCGKAHAPVVGRMLRKLPKRNVLVEPQARNTAPAIALATAHVAAVDPKGVLAVLPSDQHVARPAEFQAALKAAAEVARGGDIVTLGIKPSRPETGYGYVRKGQPLGSLAHRVQAFVEKPDVDTAERYVESGEYLWNAGIFVFRADVMLEAFEQVMPELAGPLAAVRAAIGKKAYPKVLAKQFPRMPATSIDYGVAERVKNIAVVPGDFGWSDVGSFNALPEVRELDEHLNVVSGEGAVVLDSGGCVVLAQRRPLAVVGMQDCVVVDAGDAVLVVPKAKCQDVRKAVEALKARKLERFL